MTSARLFVLGFAAAGVVLLSGCTGSSEAPLPAGVAVPGIAEASNGTPLPPPAPVVDDDRDDVDDLDDRDDDRDDLDDDRDDDRDDVDDRDDDLDDDRDDD